MTAARPALPAIRPLAGLGSPRNLIGCVLFGEGLAAVLALGADRPSWIFFGLASLGLQWILLLALGAMWLLRGRLADLSTGRVAAVAFVALLASTAVVIAVAARVMPSLGEQLPGGWLGLAGRTLAIIALVGGLATTAFRNHWEARRMAILAKQAELDVLHARIRPHFLFNTLNTATALVHSRPEEAERVLLDLSDLFRAALGKTSLILLQEELALTRRYLDIEASRFGTRLAIDWQVPDDLPAVNVPPLSIQPLIENAVRHGIEPTVDGGLVSVRVDVEDGGVVIVVRNPVADTDHSPSRGHGVGLRASIARVEASTGGRGRVTLAREGTLFVTRVLLPVDPTAPQVTTR
jgi:two-component system sensor histidine kinase AlgZ